VSTGFNGGMCFSCGWGLKPLMKSEEITPQWPKHWSGYLAILKIQADVPLFVSEYRVRCYLHSSWIVKEGEGKFRWRIN
jgi:hypothetical protein